MGRLMETMACLLMQMIINYLVLISLHTEITTNPSLEHLGTYMIVINEIVMQHDCH